ncbi:hypothetical protein Barb6_03373 [Bacteroidales bacterium Barb6]|nr:hypothetical protein Barb6_03373 [Bacteroidales bacterium Barb6]
MHPFGYLLRIGYVLLGIDKQNPYAPLGTVKAHKPLVVQCRRRNSRHKECFADLCRCGNSGDVPAVKHGDIAIRLDNQRFRGLRGSGKVYPVFTPVRRLSAREVVFFRFFGHSRSSICKGTGLNASPRPSILSTKTRTAPCIPYPNDCLGFAIPTIGCSA